MAVVVVEGKSLKYEEFAVLEGAHVKRAIEYPESKTICAGLWRFDAGTSFEWTYEEADEVLYMTEGTMEITLEGQTSLINAGDFVYFSKGTKAYFSAVNGCAGFFAAYPATFLKDMGKSG